MITSSHPSHETLLQQFHKLDCLIARADSMSAKDLRDALSVLRSDVQAHFRLEERSGPLNSLAGSDPRFQHAAERLLDEHCSLEDNLDLLIGMAGTPEVANEQFRRKLQSWIIRAKKHETDEDVLLMEAVNQDLGTAD